MTPDRTGRAPIIAVRRAPWCNSRWAGATRGLSGGRSRLGSGHPLGSHPLETHPLDTHPLAGGPA